MIIHSVLGWTGEGHVECRRCGTTLDRALDACPVCGSDDIVHYPGSVLE